MMEEEALYNKIKTNLMPEIQGHTQQISKGGGGLKKPRSRADPKNFGG